MYVQAILSYPQELPYDKKNIILRVHTFLATVADGEREELLVLSQHPALQCTLSGLFQWNSRVSKDGTAVELNDYITYHKFFMTTVFLTP